MLNVTLASGESSSLLMAQNDMYEEEMLDQLVLEEKVALLSGSDNWHTTPIARLKVPALRLSDGPNGRLLPLPASNPRLTDKQASEASTSLPESQQHAFPPLPAWPLRSTSTSFNA